jgi:hypothetical protein
MSVVDSAETKMVDGPQDWLNYRYAFTPVPRGDRGEFEGQAESEESWAGWNFRDKERVRRFPWALL